MSINWSDIRYRGDAVDVKELYDTYRIEDYLQTFEENRRRHDAGVRDHLLKHGIRLTERLSPRIYRLFQQVCKSLQIESNAEIFCLPDAEINAFALVDIQEKQTYSVIGVTAGALEKLEDSELVAILGHELGHFLFENNRLNALITQDANNSSLTVLPTFGESLFLRWRKKAEISADRVGLLANRDLHGAARGLLKATFGLSEHNLNLDIDALLEQIDELKGQPEMIGAAFASHPLLPIRLKALQLFSRSEKAHRNGYPAKGDLLGDDDLENGVAEMMRLTRRHPTREPDLAMMRLTALGGAYVLASDGDVNDEEIKLLIQIIHRYFTDEPEDVIETDPDKVLAGLKAAIAIVNEEAALEQKSFLLSRLAEVALADGALMDAEGSAILQIAEWLEVPAKLAYSIMVGAAQSVGFKADTKLNLMTAELRRKMIP